METLIRCHALRHLVWVCTVCLLPTKRTLGLYGLIKLENETKDVETIKTYFIPLWKMNIILNNNHKCYVYVVELKYEEETPYDASYKMTQIDLALRI